MIKMEKIKNQKEWIREQIVKNGRISRNQCLRNYISCLAQRIYELTKYEGFEFDADFEENKTSYGIERDFVYVWKNPANKDFKSEFTFHWIDENNNEYPVKVDAKNFNIACDVFLTQTPIFMLAVNEDVIDNFGITHSLVGNEKFRDLKTYSKPKKRQR